MAEWTVELLKVLPNDRILEIGFGLGVGIELAAKKADSGFIRESRIKNGRRIFIAV